MEHISRVVITASSLTGPITVELVGRLTLESFSTASAVLDQLSTIRSFPDLFVDLRGTAHIEPVGLAALEMYFAGHRVPEGLPEISLALPQFPRPCGLSDLHRESVRCAAPSRQEGLHPV
ncbi:hypothetical protein [Nesterenkonia sp. CF4.4]|uniref:hypothetical protein n=1 Tax=Nesterenkonia sp. CF4.4 TaxID=3373079 RepID=UPI003EE7424C